MATAKQDLGARGEALVTANCSCPRCKRMGSFRRLPTNFKCADVICDFCGYLGQVKTQTVTDPTRIPSKLLGAAWSVQRDRMDAGIYFPLFLVLHRSSRCFAIYYLSADLQTREMFLPRKPLSASARRAGWQGFLYDLGACRERLICVVAKADRSAR
jgi:hypothetical protein